MGCYCSGLVDAMENLASDASTAQNCISARLHLQAVQTLADSLEDVTVRPLLSYALPTWNKGGLSDYNHFIVTLKERKLGSEVQVLGVAPLTKEVCDTASKQVHEYWKTQENKLQPPDPDWPAVLSTLAQSADALLELQKQWKEEESNYQRHLKEEQKNEDEAKKQGYIKPQQATEIDVKTKTELDALKPKIESFHQFSLECLKLIRIFMPVTKPETEVSEVEKPVPASS